MKRRGKNEAREDGALSPEMLAALAAVQAASRECSDEVVVEMLGDQPLRVIINGDPVPSFRVRVVELEESDDGCEH